MRNFFPDWSLPDGNGSAGDRSGRRVAPLVRPWSEKVAVAYLYSSLGNHSEIKKALFRVEIVSLEFS